MIHSPVGAVGQGRMGENNLAHVPKVKLYRYVYGFLLRSFYGNLAQLLSTPVFWQ